MKKNGVNPARVREKAGPRITGRLVTYCLGRLGLYDELLLFEILV